MALKMATLFLASIACLSSVHAIPAPDLLDPDSSSTGHAPEPVHTQETTYPSAAEPLDQYNFNYEVKDKPSRNDFGHQESRNGHGTTGSFHVLLPDGRLQKVSYIINEDSGFVAEVTFEGEAKYTEPSTLTPTYN